jgi:hypothetical protein
VSSLPFKFEKNMITAGTVVAERDANEKRKKDLDTATSENEKQVLQHQIQQYQQKRKQYDAFEKFRKDNSDTFDQVRGGKAVAVFLNGDRAEGFDVAAFAQNTCYCVQVKYDVEKTGSFPLRDVREILEMMEEKTVVENLAACCRANDGDPVVIHTVCLLSSATSYSTSLFNPPMNEHDRNNHQQWKDMRDDVPQDPEDLDKELSVIAPDMSPEKKEAAEKKNKSILKRKEAIKQKNEDRQALAKDKIICKRHLTFALDSKLQVSKETVFGNLYPVMSLVLSPSSLRSPASPFFVECKPKNTTIKQEPTPTAKSDAKAASTNDEE